MHKRLLPASVLALAATLALSACSFGGGAGGGELDPEKSPLSEYYEAMYGGASDEKEMAAQQKKTEELVAACMAEEGFDYIPVDYSQYSFASPFDDENRDTEEWVAEHGYGSFQTPEERAEMDEQAEDYVDPNMDYVNALSPSEQTAYYEILQGPQMTEEEYAAMEESGEAMEFNWETQGCYGAASHEVNGDDVTQSEKYKPLMDSLNKLYDTQQKHPETVKVDAEWAACMADAGYAEFKTKQEAQESVYAESNAYWENGATEEPDEATQTKWRENEIDVALADFKCSEKVDYQDRTLKVQYDLENQFIDDNKAELDALIAEVAQAKGK